MKTNPLYLPSRSPNAPDDDISDEERLAAKHPDSEKM